MRKAFDKNITLRKTILDKLNDYHNQMIETKSIIYFKNLDKIRGENETKMLNGAREEIEKVVKKDDLFIKYTDFLKKDLNGLDTKSRLFCDIEEQWGFF